MARWRPFSITAFHLLRALRRHGVDPASIVDGGANKGQFARAAVEVFPRAEVLAVEPQPDVAEALCAALEDAPQVQVHAVALGAEEGEVQFHRQAYDLASSVLPPSEGAADETITVPLRRLDDLPGASALPDPLLLKLDLQGYEIEALRGAPKLLARAAHVLLEVSFDRAYAGEPLADDVYAFMRENSFRLARVFDPLRRDDGLVTQVDMLFEPAAE
jgi:FkbM family methyltransferase